jgi:hypothetical protein
MRSPCGMAPNKLASTVVLPAPVPPKPSRAVRVATSRSSTLCQLGGMNLQPHEVA